MGETIPHWLTKRAQLTPDQVAIECIDSTTMSFKQLASASQIFAKKLAQAGVEKGTHVGILSNNHTPMIIAIHALSYLGAVSVMLNTRLTESELKYQIEDAEVSLVLTSEELEKSAKQMEFPVPVQTFAAINQFSEKTVPLQTEIHLDDWFTIMYTSGTTGSPKGVIHTYGNHWWSAMGSALNLGLSDNDKWLAALPIFHISGLSICIRSVVYGIPIYLLEKFDANTVHQAIMERGVTIVSVVTVMLRKLIETLGEDRYPGSFRCMLLGGGPAPKPLLETAKMKNIPVFQSYGMTETASQIVTLSPKDALEKIGSAGKSLFPAQLMINTEKDEQVGEILVKGPMVTKAYFKNEAATKKSIQNGWLATGDLGYTDESGFLYVVDRRSDLIISGGENIYPSEIESVLSEMNQIEEIGVVGKEDDTWGQVPAAFIVKKAANLLADDIIAYGEKVLAAYKLPKQIYFVDYLPRNASNKLLRHKLLEWIEE